MRFGLKVHHTDIDQLLYLGPDTLEFALFPGDMGGEWVSRINFNGPIIVHAPEKFADGTILDAGSDDEALRIKTVDMLKHTIDLALQLKAELVICHPGGVFRGERTIHPQNLIKSMVDLRAYAGDRVRLVLENMPGYYRTRGELWHPCLFIGLEEIVAILDKTGVGLCLDICHAKLYCNVHRKNFMYYIEKLMPHAVYLHVSDASGEAGEGLQIGDGEIDWGWLVSLTQNLDLIAVPEIDDGFKEAGKGFEIARDRLVEMGFFKT